MEKQKKSKSKPENPEYVMKLEKSYGPPSQDGFGSAVFFDQVSPDQSIEEASLEKYKYFVGELWERWGEEAWMSQWKEVYTRQEGKKHDIVTELLSITDLNAEPSVGMILNVVKDPDVAKANLSIVYDDPDVVNLRVYNLGDGGAMSGLLVVGQRSNLDTTFLAFLLD